MDETNSLMPISSALGSSALLPAGLGFRNVITNGDMKVAQRGTSFSFGTGGGTYYYGADRWRTQDYTWSAGTNPTVSNETTVVPTGFTNAYKWANGATPLTFSSGGNQFVNQTIEGYNASALYGKTCSLSFWVRSSTAGKYSIWFTNGASTRSLLKTYTINSANTWEYKTITIDMATAVSSGVWEKATGAGLSMSFSLGSHADRIGNTNLDSWGALSSYHYATSDSVNLATIANSTFYLTGVQLEQNYQPTPFEQRPFGTELLLCQRYFEKSYNYDVAIGSSANAGSLFVGTVSDLYGNALVHIQFKVLKRVTPTLNVWSTAGVANNFTYNRSGVGDTNSSYNWTGDWAGASGGMMFFGVGTNYAAVSIRGHWAASAEL
jgi:hypothetical protein